MAPSQPQGQCCSHSLPGVCCGCLWKGPTASAQAGHPSAVPQGPLPHLEADCSRRKRRGLKHGVEPPSWQLSMHGCLIISFNSSCSTAPAKKFCAVTFLFLCSTGAHYVFIEICTIAAAKCVTIGCWCGFPAPSQSVRVQPSSLPMLFADLPLHIRQPPKWQARGCGGKDHRPPLFCP